MLQDDLSTPLPRTNNEGDPGQIITARSLYHRARFICRTQACLVVSLFFALLLLITMLSWQQPVNPSSWGCDVQMSPPHSANRVPSTKYCYTHETGPNTQIPFQDDKVEEGIRFMVIGDFGRDGFCCQLDVALEMSRAAQVWRPNFVVNVGDAFYTHGLMSAQEEQVKTSFEQVYLRYDELRVPWFSALGNHEYRGSVTAVLELGSAAMNFSEYFTMEARYWDRTVRMGQVQLHLFFLDTTPMITAYQQSGYDEEDDPMLKQPDGINSQNVTEQLVWLENRLSASNLASPGEARIVIGHHPPFTSGSHHGEDEKYLRRTLSPLFERYNVSAYFGGHDHSSQEYLKANTYYFVSGVGSMTDGEFAQRDENLRFFNDQNGFLAVEVLGRQITVNFVNAQGKTLRSTVIPF